MDYDWTKVDPSNPELDENLQPKSDVFRDKWNTFQEVVYKVCVEADRRWIKLGNGMGEYRPIIYGPEILVTGSTKQPANQWVRSVKPMESHPTEEFAGKIAGQIAGESKGNVDIVSMWTWLQWPDDSFMDWDGKPERTWSWFAWTQVNAPSIPNPDNRPFVDWSYEALCITSSMKQSSWHKNEQSKFTCTKTNYYPYDIVVTSIMAACQLIFGKEAVQVSSDGYKKDWMRWLLLLRDCTDLPVNDFHLRWERIETLSNELQKKFDSKVYLRFKDANLFNADSNAIREVDTSYGRAILKLVWSQTKDRLDIWVLNNEVAQRIQE